jgi:hypothetical protein
VLSSAVGSGLATVFDVWPEVFGLEPPGTDEPEAGPGFVLEKATPQSFAADMASLIAANQQVTIREPVPQRTAPAPEPEHTYVPDIEWT